MHVLSLQLNHDSGMNRFVNDHKQGLIDHCEYFEGLHPLSTTFGSFSITTTQLAIESIRSDIFDSPFLKTDCFFSFL